MQPFTSSSFSYYYCGRIVQVPTFCKLKGELVKEICRSIPNAMTEECKKAKVDVKKEKMIDECRYVKGKKVLHAQNSNSNDGPIESSILGMDNVDDL